MSTTTSPVQTTGGQTTQQTKKPSRRRRFLQAMKLLAGKASLNNEKIAKQAKERFESIKDKIAGTMDENDCLRRLERLKGLVAEYDGDSRYQDAVDKSRDEVEQFDKLLAFGKKKSGRVDWTDLHQNIGVSTEELLETLDDRYFAERNARSDLPKQAAADLKAVESLLATGKLSDDDRTKYTERLNRRRASLILGGQGNEQEIAEFPDKIADLRAKLQEQVDKNAGRTKRREDRHTELSNRLAAAPDTATAEARVAVADLLQQAQASTETCAFDEATALLEKAAQALNALGAPSSRKLPTADTMLDRLTTLKNAMLQALKDAAPIYQAQENYSKYQQDSVRNPKAPAVPEAAWALRERGVGLGNAALSELETIAFMLTKAPDSAVAASRLIDRWDKQIAQAKDCLADALKLLADPTASVGTGDDATERAKQLAALVKPIDDKLNNLGGLCTSLYQSADPTATTAEGDLLTRLADTRQRWTKAKGGALSADDLDAGPFLSEIERLTADYTKLNSELTAGTFGKEDVDFDKQLAAYRTVASTLAEVAKQVMESNSDAAITLGLTTKPGTLTTKAEALAGKQAQARGDAAAVTKRTAALLTLTNDAEALLEEAQKIPPGKDDTALEILRQECRDIIAGYEQRIQTAVAAMKNENLIRTGKRNEREALLQYAEGLKNDMQGIAAPLASKDEALIGEVKAGLATFDARIVDFEKRAPGKTQDKSLPKLTKVQKKAQELKTLLGNSLFAPRPDDVADLNDEVDKILEDFAARDPATTMMTLAKLAQQIADAKQKAQTEHSAANDMIFRLEGLWPKVQNAKSKIDKKYDVYLGDLVFRLRELVDKVKAKDKVEKIETDSEAALTTEAEDALAGRNLDAGLTKAEDRQKELVAVTYRLDTIEAVDIKLLKERASLLDGDEAKQLTKQIKSMESSLKVARGMIEKRDAGGAKEMAEAIQRQCKRMADAPLGSSTRARNQLPTVEARWKQASKTMDAALTKLVETVRAADTGNTTLDTAAGELEKRLNDVRVLLREDAFVGAIKRMTAGKPKPADVGSAREDALREVRRIGKMMDANPLMRQLAVNPFDKGGLPLGEIGASLWDMETNLNISG